MPNWCANRLRVTGLAENVCQLQALMRGEVRPAYARAEREGICPPLPGGNGGALSDQCAAERAERQINLYLTARGGRAAPVRRKPFTEP